MQKKRLLSVLPLLAFVPAFAAIGRADSGQGQGTPVRVSPAKCTFQGICVQAPKDHTCVDVQGDGVCDYTVIPWHPVN